MIWWYLFVGVTDYSNSGFACANDSSDITIGVSTHEISTNKRYLNTKPLARAPGNCTTGENAHVCSTTTPGEIAHDSSSTNSARVPMITSITGESAHSNNTGKNAHDSSISNSAVNRSYPQFIAWVRGK